jgi:hypothetical protein
MRAPAPSDRLAYPAPGSVPDSNAAADISEDGMRSFRIELLAGIAAIAIGAALPLVAEAAGNQKQGGVLEKIDTDKDGKISPQEMKASSDARFTERDANGDGYITRDEMIAAHQKRVEKRVDAAIKRMDKDGDGKISKAEHEAAGQKMMERMNDRKGRMGGGGYGPEGMMPDARTE